MTSPAQRSLWPSRIPGPASRDSRPRAVFADPGYPRHLWICIYFNRLPIEINLNSTDMVETVPRAVLAPVKGRQQILLCNAAASQFGVRPGQPANTALALAPELELADRDIAGETRVMGELATRATRFTPAVSIDASNALLLDVRGSLKFFGGLARLRALLIDEFEARGHGFVTACAPTTLASLWLARSGCSQVVHDCAELPGRLGELPIESLDWPADVRRLLAGIGVTTVGECIRLPRDGLARRIGPARLAELDRAFGARPESRVFYHPPRHFETAFDLSAETMDSGLLLAALQKLLTRLDEFLRRRQGGVQVLWVTLHHEGRPAVLERIGLLRASADATYLLELARIRFADLQLAAPVVAITLRTVLAELPPVAGRDLLGDPTEQADAGFALVEQLRIRLGADAVHGIRPVAEHRPEAAWRPIVFSGRVSGCHESAAASGFCYGPVSRRPVWMLHEPRELQSAAGRPVFGDVLRLEGKPERIETGWWDGRDIRRDYYVAHDHRGMRLWVYRDCREARWYLHGLFG